jgi:hypothetical protein
MSCPVGRGWIGAVALTLAISAAAAEVPSTMIYEVTTRGLRVGTVETVRCREHLGTADVTRCEVRMDVDAGFLWLQYKMSDHEIAWAGPGGVVKYRRERTEDNLSLAVEGALTNGVFHLAIAENGTNRTMDVARADYEATTRDGVETKLAGSGERRTWLVLDFETLQVVDRAYTLSGREKLRAAGRTFEARIVDYKDRNKEGRRWIVEDAFGLAILRQDGKDRRGGYSMKLVRVK